MEQPAKRFKPTKESNIAEIASMVGHIADSLKSMRDSYSDILRVNKTVVRYLRDEQHKNRVNLDQTVLDLQHSSIETDNSQQ